MFAARLSTGEHTQSLRLEPVVNSPRNRTDSVIDSRRISLFGHVARLDDDTPANMALQLHINLSLNRPPDRTWRRPPDRPRNNWREQLRNDSTRLTGDLWRRAVDREHGGATMRWPSPAVRDDDDDDDEC